MDLSGSVPSIIVAFIVVANGDRYGRKRALVLPSLGALMTNVFYSILSYFSWTLSLFFALAFISGLFGSLTTFLGGGFAFIADLCHDEKQKTKRIAVIDLILGLVSGLAGLSSGYFIRGVGFTWTFAIASLLHGINIFYIIFWLKETVDVSESQQHASLSCKESFKETFSGVYMLFKTSSCKKRTLITVLLFAFMSYFFAMIGGTSLFTLYELDAPLCWNEVYIGYGAAAFTSVSLTSFLGVYLFSQFMKDIYIVFIGIFSYIGGIIMAAFAKTTLLMFLGKFKGSENMLYPRIVQLEPDSLHRPHAVYAIFPTGHMLHHISNPGPHRVAMSLRYPSHGLSWPCGPHHTFLGTGPGAGSGCWKRDREPREHRGSSKSDRGSSIQTGSPRATG